MIEPPPLPSRLIHLPGGLRLLDERTDKIVLQLRARRAFATLKTPEYPEVYTAIANIGLSAIGVEFPTLRSVRGLAAPDWELAAPSGGFVLRSERNAWSDIKNLAHRERRAAHADLSSRAMTYLSLIEIRIFDISNIYNRALVTFDYDSDASRNIGCLFSNWHTQALDAAIHAFAADAASFRDLIVEAAWSLLALGDREVRKIERFLRYYEIGTHPVADGLSEVSRHGGWLARLSALRNDITHVAPIGGRGLRDFSVRGHSLGESKMPRLHYPIFGADGRLFDEALYPDFTDDEHALATVARYRDWLENSVDALEYAWQSAHQLIDMLTRVRIASGIRGERARITADDIVWPVVFKCG